jgi:hypothetical protein
MRRTRAAGFERESWPESEGAIAGGLMIAARPAFWRNDAKRNLVRNLRRRAAYRDDCLARATTIWRGATTNTIQSAFDRTATGDATANICTADICTAVSHDAG